MPYRLVYWTCLPIGGMLGRRRAWAPPFPPSSPPLGGGGRWWVTSRILYVLPVLGASWVPSPRDAGMASALLADEWRRSAFWIVTVRGLEPFRSFLPLRGKNVVRTASLD